MRGKNIDSHDISVVIQGPVFYERDENTGRTWTQISADSIRRHLPGAEIILSTWEGSDISGIDADTILFNKDPGKVTGNCASNTNRQKVSTLNGILSASRKYVLKLRSESYLTGREFIDAFGTFTKRSDRYRITKERVVTMGYANPYATFRPFYLADTYFFGLKDDVLNYWDTPLAPEAEKTKEFLTPCWKRLEDNQIDIWCNSEQHYFTSFVNKYLKIHEEKTESLLKISDRAVANNFIVMDGWNGNQICSMKYPDVGGSDRTRISFKDWKILYRHYCDRSYKVPLVERWRLFAAAITEQWHKGYLLSCIAIELHQSLNGKHPRLHAVLKRIYQMVRRK